MTEEEARARIAARVSRETIERLKLYADALVKWQKAINLVSPNSLSSIWARHFLDSAQLFDLRPVDEGTWLDLGSGGGFPGLVCAVLAKEAAPGWSFTLIESDLRKASFLRDVARRMEVPVSVLSRRIEDAPPQGADVISARALAPLPRLLALAFPHLAPDGICLFLKGERHEAEFQAAQTEWRMDAQTFPSQTAPGAVIYRIGGLARA